jgi:hypothetical protein
MKMSRTERELADVYAGADVERRAKILVWGYAQLFLRFIEKHSG